MLHPGLKKLPYNPVLLFKQQGDQYEYLGIALEEFCNEEQTVQVRNKTNKAKLNLTSTLHTKEKGKSKITL